MNTLLKSVLLLALIATLAAGAPAFARDVTFHLNPKTFNLIAVGSDRQLVEARLKAVAFAPGVVGLHHAGAMTHAALEARPWPLLGAGLGTLAFILRWRRLTA